MHESLGSRRHPRQSRNHDGNGAPDDSKAALTNQHRGCKGETAPAESAWTRSALADNTYVAPCAATNVQRAFSPILTSSGTDEAYDRVLHGTVARHVALAVKVQARGAQHRGSYAPRKSHRNERRLQACSHLRNQSAAPTTPKRSATTGCRALSPPNAGASPTRARQRWRGPWPRAAPSCRSRRAPRPAWQCPT